METIDASKIIDATKIEPRFKHETIINRFLSLGKDEFFLLHNDHDPVPLYYQFQAEYPDTFTWKYIEKGPEVWEVLVTKTVGESTAAEPTVGDLVAEDYRRAEVFSKFGLDFCCNGEKSVAAACKDIDADVDEVNKALKALEGETTTKMDKFNKWELDFLIDYIINNHHSYVKESTPMLYELTEKIAKVHGAHHPELIEMAPLFKKVTELFHSHMVKEESTLFPYVKKLVEAKKAGTKVDKPPFQTIQNPINQMEKEHDDTGAEMDVIRKLSNDYLVPEDGCNTYRLTFAKLEEFEKDLHQHVHLENNILFKKALALEKEVLQ